MLSSNTHNPSTVYTVSRLTSELKSLLEETYPFIWINGEISNISLPSSGHLYFTLKDSGAQISAVMFRNQCRNLKFRPENGLSVTGLGRITLYEPRGTYQIIFEFMEPKGAGALQLAFEQLKNQLASEGLFDDKHKKQLPFIPTRIGVITSPSGAVVHDIINIVNRRFTNVIIDIVPVKVQGEEAVNEIVAAFELLNARKNTDIIILARGGGSIEDFMPFNSEPVARAIFSSEIPVISSVGHETDYTIADFVSDLRAPTPSAAAELVLPEKRELLFRLTGIDLALKKAVYTEINSRRMFLESLTSKLIDPKRKIRDMQLRHEDYYQRMIKSLNTSILQWRDYLNWKKDVLHLNNPLRKTEIYSKSLNHLNESLSSSLKRLIDSKRSRLNEINGRLTALSPKAIIQRGYSITRTLPGHEILTDSEDASIDQKVEVILAKGIIECTIKGIVSNGKKKDI